MIKQTCLNCQSSFTDEGNFCPKCGAPVLKDRLSIKEVLSELFDVIFIWNRTFFRTVWALMAHPSRVFRFYITGGRNKYMNPLFYLLLCFLIYQLYISITNQQLFVITGMKGSIDGFNAGYSNGSSEQQLDLSVLDKLNRYSKILFFLILPIIAFCSKIVFKSKQYNYAEHMSICSFILGQIVLITIIISSISLLLNIKIKVIGLVISFLCIVYVALCQYQIFQNKVFKSILKSVIFLILSYLMTGIPYDILGAILVSISN